MTGQNWEGMPCVGFDVETTGVNVHEDRIVTAAFVRIKPNQRPQITTWLINPGVEIPQEAIDVHGITNERAAASGADPAIALFEITGLLARALGNGVPVVAMNAAFDLSMLEAENRRHDVPTLASRPKPISPIIDPMVLDKAVDPYRKGICAEDRKHPCQCGAVDKKLTSLCLHYGVRHAGAHDAAADALAACRLWPRIIARHPEKFRGFTLAALHQAQITWRKEQCDSLRAYFDRIGTPHDGIPSDWPIHRPPVTTVNTQGALL